MKLKIIIVLMTICLTLIPFATALASTDTPETKSPHSCAREQLCEKLRLLDKVDDCRVAFLGTYAFVALKTKGVATSSAAKQVEQEVKQCVKESCSKISEVYVSTSVKAFNAIDDINNRRQLQELLDMFGVEYKGNFWGKNPTPLPSDTQQPPMQLPDHHPRHPATPPQLT